jgi:hypothetical protein
MGRWLGRVIDWTARSRSNTVAVSFVIVFLSWLGLYLAR